MKTINSFRSKLLALTLVLMASVSTFAYEFEYVNDFHVDGFAYTVLPPTMEAPFGNVALIEIADCTEDVVIPGTVTHEGVTYIVTTLGGGATLFTNSAKEIVKSVFIPKKISTINSPLFADCSNLTSIVVDSRNSYYDSRENCNAIITTSQNSFFTPNMLIAGCKTTTIPNSVTEIADKAFYRSAIESITIPTGVTKIGHSAFNQATLLSSIKLPITLTEIGDWAFADCLSLNTISCYALEPPTISSNTFFGSNPIYNNPSVYVPAYCIEAYKNAEHWIWFTQILPINEPAYKDRWCDTWNVLTIKRDLETWQYNLAHDTIIGDYTYTAVTRHTTKVPAGVYPVMAPEPEYVAAVRFTEDKKAFIYYDNTEYLLYDFNAQPGDELTVFAGINHYRSHKTNRCGIGEVNIFPDSNYYYSREISLTVVPNYNHSGPVPTCAGITKWIEGVGDICGLITGADCGLSDDQSALLCAYKDGNTEYTTEEEEYAEYGCEYNSGENKEYILTLPGLQRTEVELSTIEGYVDPYHLSFKEYTPTLVNGKLYLCDGRNYFREENNQVLLYAPYLGMEEELVLYDWTLEVGDTLPYKPKRYTDEQLGMLFRVTDVSTIQLLDGKEYKKWTFSGGYEFVEGIGAINKGFGHFNCLRHTIHTGMSAGERLVCASRNGQLLIDNTEKWGVECQCEVETSYKSQWCDKWNMLVRTGSIYPPSSTPYRYQLAKDTVIGEHTYTAVVQKEINDALDAPHYVAAVRFTDDRKVYIYYDNAEYLLYDFNVQEGDELEVFAGINNYTSEIKTYKCTVTGVEQYACVGCPAAITLEVHNHPNDFREFYRETQWIEGVGDINGFLNGINHYVEMDGGGSEYLLCAYKGDELKYTGDLYEEYGCGDDANDDPQLPLVEWCNQWNILAHGYLGPREPLYGAKTTIYQLGADTIINHLRYKQLTRYASDDPNQIETYVGAIRFTKNNRQVYFHYDNAEYLLYDFKAQVGDTLEVFAGIDNYKYHKTYKHVVTNKEPIEDEQTKVTLEVIVTEEFEGNIYEEKFTTTWMEGVGSPDGIVHNHATQFAGSIITDLLCAYVDDRRMYRTNTKDLFGIDYTQLGCEYNDGDFIEDAFPILSGLQRTVCNEYCGETEDDNSANNTYKQTFDSIFFENDKPYIFCNGYLLREEENKILIYSQILNKDLVLYDFTLEVGDSLPALYIDYQQHNAMDWMPYNIGVVDYNIDHGGTIYPADTFVVTDVSNVTLLDGNVYKKWTFDNGMEYVEGIGMYGGRRNGNFFGLIQEVVVPCHTGTHLVCVSKNNKLLYQMDDAEMERLGAECLCDYNSGPKKDNAKNGKIGGRPTPTQWNMLEMVIKDDQQIMRAETFSYTLENDSIVANGKTFYYLARQSTKDTAITKSFVGALHFGEDEDNRVYFYHDGAEYVLYDFTAEPGDTLQLFAGINNYPQHTTYTHVVTGKDTIDNGACRMMLEVVFPEENASVENAQKVWLAGLGSIDGIVHNAAQRTSDAHAAPAKSASSETQTSVMLCAWREDSCLYTTNHPEYDTFGCVYNQDPTALESPTSPSSYQKILREGQLLIMHDGKIYTIMGIEIK